MSAERALASPPGISPSDYRAVLSRFASGVTIVISNEGAIPSGIVATSFAAVSLEPPLVLVCVGRSSSSHDAIAKARTLGVSILSDQQELLARRFAGPDRFAGMPLRHAVQTGALVVDGAAATLVLTRRTTFVAGDHTVLVGEVVDAEVSDRAPLVHWARAYRTLSETTR